MEEKIFRMKKEFTTIGNSQWVLIPSNWLYMMQWKNGDLFLMTFHNDKITIERQNDNDAELAKMVKPSKEGGKTSE